MPFRLTEYDIGFGEFLQTAAHGLASARSPILQRIHVEPSSNTVSTVVDSRDEGQLDLPAKSLGFTLTSEVEAVIACDTEAFTVALDEAAETFGQALVGMFVEAITKVTDKTGNVVKAQGEGFEFEAFLEALEKREWDLDENDELVMPQLIMHPDTAKNMPKEATPEEQARLAELKQRKHRELLARRRTRRLS